MRGQCLCGTVVFEIERETLNYYRCHCSLCRRQTGAGANAASIVPAGQFRWISGEGAIRSWVKSTGFRSDFCAECGSPVPNALRGTSYLWVPVGLLDPGVMGRCVAHLHTASHAPWDHLAVCGENYPESPALAKLIALLDD